MPRYSSDSDDSRTRTRKKKSKKHRRSSSSSSSLSSSSADSERNKPKRYQLSTYSRSHSRERSRRHRSPTHSVSHKSSPRKHSKKSYSPSYKKSKHVHKSRSSSRGKSSRRSRSGSRSDSRSRSSRVSTRRSRSRSFSPKRHRTHKMKSSRSRKLNEEELMKAKLQAAFKAAANADAELREKGLLSESTQDSKQSPQSSPELSISEQIKRAQTIEDIKSSSFVQNDFVSSRQWGKSDTEKTLENKIGTDAHSAAIFGLSTITSTQGEASIPFKIDDSWKNNPEKLAHQNLFEDPVVKLERWKKKLAGLRKRKFNGDSCF